MIQAFSSTIRRKEMDAVLTCMVDEKIGPGEVNARLIQTVKEFFSCAGALALRTPAAALKYALKALNLEPGSSVMISALAPDWQFSVLNDLGYRPLVLDVNEQNAQLTPEIISGGIQAGGRAVILREALGILPDFEGILALGIPVIEDISQSAGGFVPEKAADAAAKASEGQAASEKTAGQEEEGSEKSPAEIKGKKAGTFGLYSICSLEENDIITAGGGALILAPGRREWPVLKSIAEGIPSIELLPDINAALATVQFKEFGRNEAKRKEIFSVFSRSVLSGKNRTFVRDVENASTVWSFPLFLNGGFKDVKAYTQKKDIQIEAAFADSVVEKYADAALSCKVSKSLMLRTAVFPLYPRLGKSQIEKIAKVLLTLP